MKRIEEAKESRKPWNKARDWTKSEVDIACRAAAEWVATDQEAYHDMGGNRPTAWGYKCYSSTVTAADFHLSKILEKESGMK